MKNKINNLFVLISVMFLSSCAMQASQVSDDAEIGKGEGIAVFNLHTTYDGHKNPFKAKLELLYVENENDVLFKSIVFEDNNDFKVYTLKEGSYKIVRIRLSNDYLELETPWKFTVTNNKISYIGDIRIDAKWSSGIILRKIEVFNDLPAAKLQLKKILPKTSKKYEVIANYIDAPKNIRYKHVQRRTILY